VLKGRFLLLICVAVIFALGLVMVFNTSSADVLDRHLSISTHAAVTRQLIYGLLGICAGACIFFVGYEVLVERSLTVMAILTLLLLLVFVPGIGDVRNGSHRWIGAAGLTVQPSEFVKLGLPLFAIHALTREMLTPLRFARFGCMAAIPLLLIMMEPDNGTTAIIGATLVVVCLITGVNARYWLLPMVSLALVGGLVAWQLPYVQKRIQVYMHPELDLLGKGHQPHQAKIAAGAGGVLGRGLGQSMQKLTYLPEAQNDYIAAVYAEECGLVGVLALILLYMLLALFGFRIACRAADPHGFYLAATLTALISIQAFLNLGVVSGLMPPKGLNLPFFSQGGSSLMANILAVALLFKVDAEADRHHSRRNRGPSDPGTGAGLPAAGAPL
jgi:cell division protein FtsW